MYLCMYVCTIGMHVSKTSVYISKYGCMYVSCIHACTTLAYIRLGVFCLHAHMFKSRMNMAASTTYTHARIRMQK
jgi:hypothetical protein